METIQLLKKVIRFSFFLFFIFIDPVYSQTIKNNQTVIIENLRTLNNKLDRFDTKLDDLSNRMSSMEAWRDQRMISEQRFYDENRKTLEKMSSSIEGIEKEMDTTKGIAIAIIAFGSILSFGFSAWLQIYLSKKDRKDILIKRSDVLEA